VDVISDYLGRFHEYVCEELQKTTLLHEYKQHQYKYVSISDAKGENLIDFFLFSALLYLQFGLMKQKH
jgi:hypothetical protein